MTGYSQSDQDYANPNGSPPPLLYDVQTFRPPHYGIDVLFTRPLNFREDSDDRRRHPAAHTHFSCGRALLIRSLLRVRPLAASTEKRDFVAIIAAHYGRRLHRFLSVHLRDVHDVPDLAQEVYLRLLRVNNHESIRNPEAYLFTVASHVLQQHALRQSAEARFVDITDALSELTSPAGEDPTTRSDNAQRIERLEQILAQLPPRVAAALVLARLGGHTVQEIADQLGVARETAKKYLARAAQHCRKSRAGRKISD